MSSQDRLKRAEDRDQQKAVDYFVNPKAQAPVKWWHRFFPWVITITRR